MFDSRKLLICLAICIAAVFFLRLVNLKKDRRGRQALLPCITPILLVMITLIVWNNTKNLNLMASGYEGAEHLLRNLIVYGVFFVVRIPILIILGVLWRKDYLMKSTSDSFYKHDDDYGVWLYRDNLKNLQSLFTVLSWFAGAVAGIILALGWMYGKKSAFFLPLYPLAAACVITEASNFLSGCTKEEYLVDVGGDDIASVTRGAYSKLRRIFEKTFPQDFLVSRVGSDLYGKEGATELIRTLLESDDQTDRVVGGYFDHLKRKNGLFDVDLVTLTNTLMHGHSAVAMDPFYRDLGEYLRLPLVSALIRDKKCLLVVGRGSQSEDVIDWIREELEGYSRTRALWRVSALTGERPDCEVGVLDASRLYDLRTIRKNEDFLAKVGCVLLIEPSRMLATSQSGLRILAEKLKTVEPPVYCIIDHDTDGLVDALSHVLETEIVHVTAMPTVRASWTAMGWAASGDFLRQRLFKKQTHYLGNGMELSAVALKNQISHTVWISESKTPVLDIRWLAGQYYPQICDYAHLENQQRSIEEKIDFDANLWNRVIEKNAFLIVEDEFCNLFEAFRDYLTRGDSQSFVNVISENYLLRDYMRYNGQLFMTDPKAIPGIAPFYSKSERNTVLRLILKMACSPVRESEIVDAFTLLGYEVHDTDRFLQRMIRYYTFVEDTVFSMHNTVELDEEYIPQQITYFSISRPVFDEYFADTLKNAYFVIEDEKFATEIIDARLFEHITQLVMPGQFVTYSGKYYRVQAVSPEIGCVLHRAADSYGGRRYYRQIRRYHLDEESEPVTNKKIGDMEIAVDRRSFTVETTGYLDMADSHDLRSARLIDLSQDPSIGRYTRTYKHKAMMRISLPDADVNVRFTLCVLLSELFHTLFPDAWPYISAVSVRPDDVGGLLNHLNYHIDGAVDETMIYIIEDSDMDLGLLEAVSNNLERCFEILTDYLEWHAEKMKEPPYKDPVVHDITMPEDEKIEHEGRIRRFLRIAQAMLNRHESKVIVDEIKSESDHETDVSNAENVEVSNENNTEESVEIKDNGTKGYFENTPKRNNEREVAPYRLTVVTPENDEAVSSDIDDESVVEDESVAADIAGDATSTASIDTKQNEEITNEDLSKAQSVQLVPPPEEVIVLHTEGEDLFPVDNVPDDLDILMPIEQTSYQKNCYLKFGFDEIDAKFVIEDVRAYLTARGWRNNALTKARKREEADASLLDIEAENQCDFCGLPLSCVSYEQLEDGRIRCNDCSSTAINSVKAFTSLFHQTLALTENLFDIRFRAAIKVNTCDARKLAKHVGMVFVPSKGVATRAVGYAQRQGNKFTLHIENGSPRLMTIMTIAHELTHIWQYLNWDDKKIVEKYGNDKNRLIVYEGMASWIEIQVMYAIGETTFARQQELLLEKREDEYGIGYRLYREKYGIYKGGEIPVYSPFHLFPPL